MNNLLKIDDLDGVKLAQDENFPPVGVVLDALEHAFSQGSQGWGVTREVAALLFIARELHHALDVARTAEDNHRMLKGAQMEGGRLKKKIEKLEAESLAYDLRVKELEAHVESLTDAAAAATGA